MSRVQGSIVRRLVALALVAGLVTGLVGILVVGAVERRNAREESAARNLAAAERLATVIDGRVAALRAQMELLASRGPVIALEDAETELAVALRVSDDLDQLVLYGRTGRAVAASSSSRLLSAGDIAARPDLVRILQSAGPQVTVVSDERSAPSIEIAVAVEDPPGRAVGALVGSAPVALVSQGAGTTDPGSGGAAFLVDEDGTVIAHRELDRVLDGERFPLREVFSDDRRVVTVRTGGEPVLTAGAPLAAFPGWVVVEQPEPEAIAAADAATAEATWVFLAVLAAIVAAVVLAGHRLLRPLVPLAEAVDRLGHGDLGVRVETGGIGEVGVLAEGFNRMAAALQARQRDLEEAERAARRSEERLRLMVEGVEEYAIVLLDLDGAIRSWNTGARRLLGPDAEHAVGRSLSSFLDPEDAPDDPLLEAAREGRSDVEGWCRGDDGRRFFARIVATSLRDEAGQPYGYAVVLHDLTARHQAKEATEAALVREREAAEELRRTNRLKDEFLAVAAHEIRTPLSAILGASDVLSQDWDDLDEEERLRFRDIIGTHANDMRAVVERLLDLTRLQAGKVRLAVETVRLDEELRRDVDLVRPQLSGHQVRVDAPSAEVQLDPQALRHIVVNLVSNASKFSPPQSLITVSAAVEGSTVTLEVADQGPGIPAEEHEQIFEMFHQSSDSTARGTGVGLAIVRRYARLSGGDVEVESTPGRGATFRVTLHSPHRG